jgi:hypothetical protein
MRRRGWGVRRKWEGPLGGALDPLTFRRAEENVRRRRRRRRRRTKPRGRTERPPRQWRQTSRRHRGDAQQTDFRASRRLAGREADSTTGPSRLVGGVEVAAAGTRLPSPLLTSVVAVGRHAVDAELGAHPALPRLVVGLAAVRGAAGGGVQQPRTALRSIRRSSAPKSNSGRSSRSRAATCRRRLSLWRVTLRLLDAANSSSLSHPHACSLSRTLRPPHPPRPLSLALYLRLARHRPRPPPSALQPSAPSPSLAYVGCAASIQRGRQRVLPAPGKTERKRRRRRQGK